MAKTKERWICSSCHEEAAKWSGQCPSCGAWNTMEQRITPVHRVEEVEVYPINKVPATNIKERLSTGVAEIDRVFGGGIMPGSVTLLGGEPGIGKTTLLLKAAHAIAAKYGSALYISGEESAAQVRIHAERANLLDDRFMVLAETRAEPALFALERTKPALCILDSIQTVRLQETTLSMRSVTHDLMVATMFREHAKKSHCPLIIIGHFTKDGEFAGANDLQHDVDAVFRLEGERGASDLRILRAIKNRFGATDEVGIFEITETGMKEVADPAGAWITGREPDAPGSVIFPALEGSRVLPIEIQALTAPQRNSSPQLRTSGIPRDRAEKVLAVLLSRAGVPVDGADVFISTTGGVWVNDPAVDLAIASAIWSSVMNRPIPPDLAVAAEVGLAGELRHVPRLNLRERECERRGMRLLTGTDQVRRATAIFEIFKQKRVA